VKGLIDSYKKRKELFLTERKPIDGCVYRKKAGEGGIYFKGGKVSTADKPASFDYDLSSDQITLTEDRTLEGLYTFKYYLVQELVKLTDKNIIKKMLTAEEDTFEGSLPFDTYVTPSKEFLEVLKQVFKKGFPPNVSLQELCKKHDEEFTLFKTKEPTEDQKDMLDFVIKNIINKGIYIKEFKINILKQPPESVYGMVHEGEIYIADRAFNAGPEELTATLMEEYIHAKYGVYDFTRAFQDEAMKMIATLIAK
jgi:hypothetical protein